MSLSVVMFSHSINQDSDSVVSISVEEELNKCAIMITMILHIAIVSP